MNEDTEKFLKENEESPAGSRPLAGTSKRDDLTYRIIGSAMSVHSELGPGLLENVYENALCIEFDRRGIRYVQQKRIRVQYMGEDVGDMVADLILENRVIVELKSVKQLGPLHEAQIIAYLRAAKLKTGLLINFNVVALKSGIRRYSV